MKCCLQGELVVAIANRTLLKKSGELVSGGRKGTFLRCDPEFYKFESDQDMIEEMDNFLVCRLGPTMVETDERAELSDGCQLVVLDGRQFLFERFIGFVMAGKYECSRIFI
jgi:hypothetical protein